MHTHVQLVRTSAPEKTSRMISTMSLFDCTDLHNACTAPRHTMTSHVT